MTAALLSVLPEGERVEQDRGAVFEGHRHVVAVAGRPEGRAIAVDDDRQAFFDSIDIVVAR